VAIDMAASAQHPASPPAVRASGNATDDFVALLLANQRRVYSFIGALLPNRIDLDDVYQQTCMMLWEKRALFDPTKPFLPWAYAFARHEAFNHARRKRAAGIVLSDRLLEQLACEREQADGRAENRRAALEQCVNGLAEGQRDLLRERYEGLKSVKEMAAERKMSAAALTMRLQRIRHALIKCVERALGNHTAGSEGMT